MENSLYLVVIIYPDPEFMYSSYVFSCAFGPVIGRHQVTRKSACVEIFGLFWEWGGRLPLLPPPPPPHIAKSAVVGFRLSYDTHSRRACYNRLPGSLLWPSPLGMRLLAETYYRHEISPECVPQSKKKRGWCGLDLCSASLCVHYSFLPGLRQEV